MPKTTGCRLRRSTSKGGFEKITPKENIRSFSAQTSKKYPNAFPVRRDGLVTSLWRTHNTSSASSDWLQPDWLIERTSDVTRCSLNEQHYMDSRKIKRRKTLLTGNTESRWRISNKCRYFRNLEDFFTPSLLRVTIVVILKWNNWYKSIQSE